MIVTLSKYICEIIENEEAMPFDEENKFINRHEYVTTVTKLSSIDEYSLNSDNDLILTIHGQEYYYLFEQEAYNKIVRYFEALNTDVN